MNPAPHSIEIIGGGLAGLSLGLALRHAGVAVTIFEAGDYPRHRVCGEFISGLSAATLQRLGLVEILADAAQHREVAWFFGAEPIRVQRLPTPALGISRHELDQRLSRAFVAAGGELRVRERITDLTPREGRVMATGRRRGRTAWMGLKMHVKGLSLNRELEMHLGTDAYVGLSRIEEGTVNVCGLFRRRALCAKGAGLLLGSLQAAQLPALAARIAGATMVPTSFCAVVALDFNAHVPASEGVHLVDACAMIPPFTGNGMAMAFQTAETALDPLIDYARGNTTWPAICRSIQNALQKRFFVRLASAAVLHPFMLRPSRQRWMAAASRTRLLPFTSLYKALH